MIRTRFACVILMIAISAGLMASPASKGIAQETVASGIAETSRNSLDPDALSRHVYALASPQFAGRRGPSADKTVDYLKRHFERAGLSPGFPEGYVQEISQTSSGKVIGRNVAAAVRGSDPSLREEWIVLSAHWDHLGPSLNDPDKYFPGADDNASGVAMLLETATWFARPENRPKRSVLFVAFDLEEFGLFGSRHFAGHMPFDADRLKLFVTADMIGRSLSGMCREWVFVIGSERLPQSRQWLKQAAQGRSIRAGTLGTDLVGVRSDYGPFMTKKIPYLFFSTGESEVYHSIADRPETIDYAKLHQISEVILETVAQAADVPTISGWSETPVAAPEELTVIAAVLEEMKSPENGLKLGGLQRSTIDRTLEKIRKLIETRTVSDSDRRAVIRAAQFLMFSAL
jgi:hypothetical protein